MEHAMHILYNHVFILISSIKIDLLLYETGDLKPCHMGLMAELISIVWVWPCGTVIHGHLGCAWPMKGKWNITVFWVCEKLPREETWIPWTFKHTFCTWAEHGIELRQRRITVSKVSFKMNWSEWKSSKVAFRITELNYTYTW